VRKVIVLTAAVGMLGTTAAIAQTTDQQQTRPQVAPQTTQPTQPPVGTPPSPQAQTPGKSTTMQTKPGQQAFLSQQQPDQMLASDLMNKGILGGNNERIGSVDDLLLAQDGQVQAVLVGVGGFLGIGQKTVAIPFDALKRSPESNQLTTSYSRQELEQAPEFVTMERETGRTGTGTGGAGGTGTTGGSGSGTAR